MAELLAKGIQTQVHYIPVHTQPFYRERYGTKEGQFPHAEAFYRQALSLPLYPGMTDDDVEKVIHSILGVLPL